MENLPANVPRTLLNDLVEIFAPTDTPQNSILELVISISDEQISTRELAAYLALIDRVYGRTRPEGLISYSHREYGRLHITEIRKGSTEIIFQAIYEFKEITAFAILLLFLRSLPNMFKLSTEGVKYLAEAYKSYEEGRLIRENRRHIRDVIQQDPTLERLDESRRSQLVTLMEALFAEENNNLPAPIRFARKYVKGIFLRTKKKGER